MTASDTALLAGLLDPALDPLFAPPSLSGVLSAWYGHLPFAGWIVAAARPDCLVELGSHCGVSYAAFCDAVMREGLDTRCYAVDTWEGDDHAGHYGNEIFESLKRFHDSRYAGFSEMLRMRFDDAAAYFADGSIDLLHIDGLHTEAAVRHDFEHWRQKLSSRAVVLFHDTNVRERDFGVWKLFAELRRHDPGFEFLHGHGLGLLQVGADVPEPVRALCALADPAAIARVRSRFAAIGQAYARHREGEERIAALEAELARARAAREPQAALPTGRSFLSRVPRAARKASK